MIHQAAQLHRTISTNSVFEKPVSLFVKQRKREWWSTAGYYCGMEVNWDVDKFRFGSRPTSRSCGLPSPGDHHDPSILSLANRSLSWNAKGSSCLFLEKKILQSLKLYTSNFIVLGARKIASNFAFTIALPKLSISLQLNETQRTCILRKVYFSCFCLSHGVVGVGQQ